jgi:hypothetical protein
MLSYETTISTETIRFYFFPLSLRFSGCTLSIDLPEWTWRDQLAFALKLQSFSAPQ